MKLVIISGSHRYHSQSEKVANYAKQQALQAGLASSVEVVSLSGNPLPLWDEGVWAGEESWQKLWQPMSDKCVNADAFIVISPEWHGQVPAGLKNLMLLLDGKEVGHKPALIIAVSASDGGAYPVAELRMSSYKNNRICYLPEHLIVRNVESVFNEDDSQNDTEAHQYFSDRLAWNLQLLDAYAKALTQVRGSVNTDNEAFPFGM